MAQAGDGSKKKLNLLTAVAISWAKLRPEFDDQPGEDDSGNYADVGAKVGTDEVKKVCTHLQHIVTKFGASAHVADESDVQGLAPIAEQLGKGFQIAVGTLLAIRPGAGPTLRAQLRDCGNELASALVLLGESVGTPDMSVYAGKVLDRIKHLEKVPTHNRAAIRRCVLRSLAQVRDAHRELDQALQESCEESDADDAVDDEDDDDDDLGDFDAKLDPEERCVVEAISTIASFLEEMLKHASQACMPADDAAPIAALESVMKHAVDAGNALDGLAAATIGGVDSEDIVKSLANINIAVVGFQNSGEKAANRDIVEQLCKASAAAQAAVEGIAKES